MDYENKDEVKAFALMMRVTWQNYGRNPPDRETMRYWFTKLEQYDIQTVTKAFDNWIDSSGELPTIKNIADGCRHKPTIFARLPSPLAVAENHRHATEVKEIADKLSGGRTMRGRDLKLWAKKILDNQKSYPEKSVVLAKQALGVEDD